MATPEPRKVGGSACGSCSLQAKAVHHDCTAVQRSRCETAAVPYPNKEHLLAARAQPAAADGLPDKKHLPRVGQQTAGPQNSHRAAPEDAPRDSPSVALQHGGICLQHQHKALQVHTIHALTSLHFWADRGKHDLCLLTLCNTLSSPGDSRNGGRVGYGAWLQSPS